MKYIKIYFLIQIIFLFTSCSTLKDGFKNQKKGNSDEFLVEKKSPLIMPPEFNELPTPEINDSVNNPEDDIKKLLSINDELGSSEGQSEKDNNFENSILEKIKNN